ncbi:hypothetical protein [Leuconostoc lactis]|uniref:hypothetical protein n=1 Tax=Leuconostoc lactis TaxID=1246 RepID=UPI001144D463|nr:hypothetical protein [Leuconostoc lactis]GEB41023.1 hypothetical protein LLA04_14110 [Leuconostoc lactis]
METWLILFFVGYALFVKITYRKLIFALIILSIAMYSQVISGTSTPFIKLLMLIVAVPRTIPSVRAIIKTFGIAMSTTLILTIFLSIVGYLPISGETSRVLFSNYQETVYFFGFTHPNIFGTFLTTIFMILYFLYFKRTPKLVISVAIIFLIIDKVIAAGTASVGIAMILVLTFIHSVGKKQIWLGRFGKLGYFLPLILTAFSFWLADNNTSQLGMFINEKIASRPNIWHAYLTQYPIKVFNTIPDIQLDGINTILGNGALDGGYIYVLINFGIIAWIVYTIIFDCLIKIGIQSNNFQLYSIALVIILMSFPESHMIMFFENVFLILFGFYQYPKSQRIQLLRQ